MSNGSETVPAVGRQLGIDQDRERLHLHRLLERLLGAGRDHDLVAGMLEERLDPLLDRGVVVRDQDHRRLRVPHADGRLELHRPLLDARLLLGKLDQLADVLHQALAALVDVRHEFVALLGRRLVGALVEQDLGEADDGVER